MATQTQLDEARAALHQLLLGRRAVKIQKDGRTVEYTPASKRQLEEYIGQLEVELGAAGRRRGPAGVFA
tara:strand:- start:22231 stop:22437 length:207 start_codon:yes stop_codon:yes gene_type:complete